MFGAQKKCAKCDKQVYPIEELKCLDKMWHKNCFKCTVCNSLLNMKNYKGFDKQPYCVVHYPQQKPTVVSDNPELLRIKENTKIQSNAKYHEDFEKSKGTYTVVADDPETRRILENTKIISQVKYHEDFEKNIKNKHITSGGVENNTQNHYNHTNGNHSQYSTNGNGLVATFKSGVGNGNMISPNERSTPYVVNNVMNGNGLNGHGHNMQPVQQQKQQQQTSLSMAQQQQRKIGSIADYDPLSYESTTANLNGVDRLGGRSVYSTGNLQNGRAQMSHANTYNSSSNIGNYTMSNGNGNGVVRNNGNGSTIPYNNNNHHHHHYNGTNGVHNNNNNNFNHDLEYDVSVTAHQQKQQQFYQNDIKTSVYKAIYDYDAKEDDEISFRDGDKFINCEQIDIGWMIGVHEKTGKHGMFPANYAEPVDYF